MYLKIWVISLSILIFWTSGVFSQSNSSKSDTFSMQKERETLVASLKPKILSRQDWRAKKPIKKMKQHEPSYITIHHSATSQKRHIRIERKMRNLQNFSQSAARLANGHFKKAWADVPYHFYIDVNGKIAEGRDMRYSGDTNTNYDPSGHILVVLEGNFEKTQPSTLQLQSLEKLVFWLASLWEISPNKIKGHKDYASTVCPGKNLENQLSKIRQSVGSSMVKRHLLNR